MSLSKLMDESTGGWGWEAVINLSKMIDYALVLLSLSYLLC